MRNSKETVSAYSPPPHGLPGYLAESPWSVKEMRESAQDIRGWSHQPQKRLAFLHIACRHPEEDQTLQQHLMPVAALINRACATAKLVDHLCQYLR